LHIFSFQSRVAGVLTVLLRLIVQLSIVLMVRRS
jgi:hypothetical protein